MEEQLLPQDGTAEVVDIQFRPGQKVYYFDPAGFPCKAGDHVIMDTARGPEFGYCTAGNHHIPLREVVAPLRPVLRLATEQDERIAAENQIKEKKAFEVCLQKIKEQNLDMQLVGAECAFDGSKLLFFFTADERVDFRELVKSLASVFHTRIELRQIGVRDKAKMVGGLGICGRPFCCATFLEDFQPVSIKMAKTQNLSLNPTKISGTCGRLMCCLKYEQEAYEDLIRNSPKAESFVDTPEGRGTVVELDLLRQRVKVRMEQNPETITSFRNDEIAVLRNGKAKKNDPPIPADLAPISGSGKRVRKEEQEERLFMDPIKFRYSDESVVEEPVLPEPELTEEPKAPKSRRSRRNKEAEAPKAEEPKAEKPEKSEKAEKPEKKAEKPEKKAEKPRPARKPKDHKPKKEAEPKEPAEVAEPKEPKEGQKPRRRPNYRHRRPRANKESVKE